MKDAIGDRIKNQYENRTRIFLPRRTYTIIRIDGKAFHSFTREFNKPFDNRLMSVMDLTAVKLCENIQGAQLAYVQSDEISILMTDFKKPTSDAWFDGNIQKIASISASMATAYFAEIASTSSSFKFWSNQGLAMFDARVFTIPDPIEVENYFIWRQQDASRNSIQMAARAVYSHKECTNKNTSQLQDMLHEKGINWNDYTPGEKRGRVIKKETYIAPPNNYKDFNLSFRTKWVTDQNTPIFTKDRDYLKNMIPRIGEENAESKVQENS